MGRLKYFCAFVALIIASSEIHVAQAKPEGEAAAPAAAAPAAAAPAAAGAAPAGGGGAPTVIDLDATTTESAAKKKIIEDMAGLRIKTCSTLFGDCWVLLKARKSFLKEEIRLKICTRKTLGFSLCKLFTPENATKAKDDTEGYIKQAWDEKEKKAMERAKRMRENDRRSKDMKARAEGNTKKTE